MSSSQSRPEAALARLEWTVLRRLDGLLQGDYRSLFRGFGMDLADIREYEPGDDVRFIDWNVTARLDAPYVRRYDEDREVTAWLLLDVSPSVDFGSGGKRKLDLLADFAGAIARVLTRRGNRVGALIYDGAALEALPARGGKEQVLALLKRLAERPELDRAPPTDLGRLLRSALDLIKRRSLVFIVSDFMSLPRWTEPLAYLRARHETIAVRLVDPLEAELPDLGIVAMRDAETGDQLYVDTHDRRFRERFAEAARAREEALRRGLADAGVDALELSTEGDLAEAVLRFAELRKRRAGLSGGGTAPAARRTAPEARRGSSEARGAAPAGGSAR